MKLMTLLGACALLAACAPPGQSRRVAIDQPLTENYVQIVSASLRLVEVDSAGRLVRAPAPEGLCISKASIQTGRGSVFMLLNGCGGARAEGVLSLTISNAPMDEGPEALEAFLRSAAGRVGLGYGGEARDVELIEMRRDESAVFAVAADRSEFGPAFAGDLIGRAFVEVNGRLVVATILSRRDREVDAGRMRAALDRYVDSLRSANAKA